MFMINIMPMPTPTLHYQPWIALKSHQSILVRLKVSYNLSQEIMTAWKRLKPTYSVLLHVHDSNHPT